MPELDYIITGAGCAGLSLAVRMLGEPSLCHKKILIADKSLKATNDRTWCFWEKEPGFFEDIVHHRWTKLWFHGYGRSQLMPTMPYTYKMIRGIDFYKYCFDRIRQFPNVSFLQGSIGHLHSDDKTTYAVIDGDKYPARYIFNSISFPTEGMGSRKDWSLLQHFKGWIIRSLKPSFDPAEATLMDFRVPGGPFVYVLPFSPTRALVECTFFSESVLQESEYTPYLTEYISKTLNIKDYIIEEKELGVIPMTSHSFSKEQFAIRNIGSAAGLTKPSTGYTFKNIQDDSAAIIDGLVGRDASSTGVSDKRFKFYDRILLNVLATHKLTGEEVFAPLFINNALPDIFSFLDNASTPAQDWKIIRSLPSIPFVRAAFSEIIR